MKAYITLIVVGIIAVCIGYSLKPVYATKHDLALEMIIAACVLSVICGIAWIIIEMARRA